MVVGEIERHDVWLALVGARQPPKIRTGQQVQTLLPAQFLDQHDYDSLASPLCGGIYLRRWRIGIHIQLVHYSCQGRLATWRKFSSKVGRAPRLRLSPSASRRRSVSDRAICLPLRSQLLWQAVCNTKASSKRRSVALKGAIKLPGAATDPLSGLSH